MAEDERWDALVRRVADLEERVAELLSDKTRRDAADDCAFRSLER